MACKIPNIEALYRDVNPDKADYATTRFHEMWSIIKDSKVFNRKENPVNYFFADKGTKAYAKQQELLDKIDKTYGSKGLFYREPTNSGHGYYVKMRKSEFLNTVSRIWQDAQDMNILERINQLDSDHESSPSEYPVQYHRPVNSLPTELDLDHQWADEVIKNIADKFKDKFGIEYNILSQDEAENLISEAGGNYNGESGFYLNGKVYFVQGVSTSGDVFHEYAHPFIAALQKQNKVLYDNLYKKLLSSKEGFGLDKAVRATYSEDNLNEDLITQEVMVRALNDTLNKNLSEPYKGFFGKLLFAIRQMLRKAFGVTKGLDKLNLNTTLEELGKIFEGEGKFDINTDFSPKDVVQFNKDSRLLAKDLEEVLNGGLIVAIPNLHTLVKHQSSKIISGKKAYGEIKEHLKGPTEVNDLATAASMFNKASDTEDNVQKAKSLAIALNAISTFSGRIVSDIDRVVKDSTIGSDEKLRIMDAHEEMLSQYSQYLDLVDNTINEFEGEIPSTFKEYMDELRGKVSRGLKKINSIKKDAVAEQISKVLSPVSLDARAKLNEARRRYESNPDKAGAKAKYEKDKEKLEARIYEVKNVKDYLEGKNGDVKLFPTMWSSLASSDDPILASTATYITTALNKSLERSRVFQRDMNKELDPFLKVMNTVNPTKAFEKYVYKEAKSYYDQDGKVQSREVYSLLNPYQGYQEAFFNLKNEIKLAKESGNEELTLAKKIELNELKAKWMNRTYTDDYYKVMENWKSPVGEKARIRMNAIQTDIDFEESMYESSTEDEQSEIRDKITELHRQRRALYSLTDLQGNTKEGDDFEIAKFLKEQSVKSKDIFNYDLKMGVFESAYNTFLEGLKVDGLSGDEYNARVKEWISENTKSQYTQAYYDRLNSLNEKIKEILSQEPDPTSEEVSGLYTKIFDIANIYRDQDGIVIGTDLSKDQIAQIKNLENRIEELRAAQKKEDGDQAMYYSKEIKRLTSLKLKDPSSFTEAMQEELDEANKEYEKYNNSNKTVLNALFQSLAELKNTSPTEYYFDALDANAANLKVDYRSMFKYDKSYISVASADSLLQDDHFREWFLANHKEGAVWDETTKETVPVYKRISIWNRADPEDQYKEKTVLSDGTVIPGVPVNKYYRRIVKDKYKNEKVVGKTIDSNGRWLPRLDKAGSPFVNKAYFNLSNTDREFVDTLAEWYLKSQEGLEVRKPGYEIPRFYKDLSETNIIKETKTKITEFYNSTTRFQDMLGNFISDGSSFSKYAKIPLHGIGIIDELEKVSLDLPTIIQRFAASSFQNQELQKAQPFAQSVSEVLKDDTGNKAMGLVTDLASRFNFGNSIRTSNESTRKRAYDSFYRTMFEGEIIDPNTPEWIVKTSQVLMGAAAFTSLSLNIPGAMKNWTSGSIQSYIRATGGKDINVKSLTKGQIKSWEIINDLIRDKNNTSNLSINTQLFDAFDPTAGKERHEAGKRVSGSYTRDFYNFKWLHSGYEFGEYQIGISFWQGMMYHQSVEQKLSNGETRLIPYAEAFEKDADGNPKLKAGIDEGWNIGGDKFYEFKNKLHENMQLAQGNYDTATRPLAAKSVQGRYFYFMRKYLVPGLTARFGRSGINARLGDSDMSGYYITAFKFATSWIKSKAYNWSNLSDQEKGDVLRTASELGTSLLFGLILRLLFGWNPDDKDKYKKLQDNSWATNMLIYQIMATKSESEQFIPLPQMGLQELVKMKNTPSIAFGHLDKWVKLLESGSDYMGVAVGLQDPSVLSYQKKSGIYDKGDSKGLASLFRVLGYNGSTSNPDAAIKSFTIAQSRTK